MLKFLKKKFSKEPDYLFRNCRSILEKKNDLSGYSSYQWANFYEKQYIKSKKNGSLIQQYNDLGQIYGLFYKYRGDVKVADCLITNNEKSLEIFYLIMDKENTNLDLITNDGSVLKSYYKDQYGDDGLALFSPFKCTSLLYEKLEMYEDAINICKKAIKLGYEDDGTKNGMSGRIIRLEKKLKLMNEK